MKSFMALIVLLLSLKSFAVVYQNETQSILPQDVRAFVNESVQEFCQSKGFTYNAHREVIEAENEGTWYLADLSVSEGHALDAYFIVGEKRGELYLIELECPRK